MNNEIVRHIVFASNLQPSSSSTAIVVVDSFWSRACYDFDAKKRRGRQVEQQLVSRCALNRSLAYVVRSAAAACSEVVVGHGLKSRHATDIPKIHIESAHYDEIIISGPPPTTTAMVAAHRHRG